MSKLRGFSLLELAIILSVGGVLITIALSMFNSMSRTNDYKKTNEKLYVIEQRIIAYFKKYKKLPCPNNSSVKNQDCLCSFADEKEDYYIGKVPILDLGLSSNYKYDEYSNEILLMVDKNFTCNNEGKLSDIFYQNEGRINILDLSEKTLTSKAVYSIISKGLDRKMPLKLVSNEIKKKYDEFLRFKTKGQLFIASKLSAEITKENPLQYSKNLKIWYDMMNIKSAPYSESSRVKNIFNLAVERSNYTTIDGNINFKYNNNLAFLEIDNEESILYKNASRKIVTKNYSLFFVFSITENSNATLVGFYDKKRSGGKICEKLTIDQNNKLSYQILQENLISLKKTLNKEQIYIINIEKRDDFIKILLNGEELSDGFIKGSFGSCIYDSFLIGIKNYYKNHSNEDNPKFKFYEFLLFKKHLDSLENSEMHNYLKVKWQSNINHLLKSNKNYFVEARLSSRECNCVNDIENLSITELALRYCGK